MRTDEELRDGAKSQAYYEFTLTMWRHATFTLPSRRLKACLKRKSTGLPWCTARILHAPRCAPYCDNSSSSRLFVSSAVLCTCSILERSQRRTTSKGHHLILPCHDLCCRPHPIHGAPRSETTESIRPPRNSNTLVAPKHIRVLYKVACH